jgi:hypothetical protein
VGFKRTEHPRGNIIIGNKVTEQIEEFKYLGCNASVHKFSKNLAATSKF